MKRKVAKNKLFEVTDQEVEDCLASMIPEDILAELDSYIRKKSKHNEHLDLNR